MVESLTTGEENEYTTTNTNITVTNLSPYTTYVWTIAASTSVGIGPNSTAINVLMPEDGKNGILYLVILLTVYFPTAPNGAPRNLSGVSSSSRRIYLTWHPPPEALTNGIIREYYVNVTDTVTGEVQLLSSQSEVLEITNLHPYYTYKVAVAAYTVALGPFTDQITVQTLEDGALLKR